MKGVHAAVSSSSCLVDVPRSTVTTARSRRAPTLASAEQKKYLQSTTSSTKRCRFTGQEDLPGGRRRSPPSKNFNHSEHALTESRRPRSLQSSNDAERVLLLAASGSNLPAELNIQRAVPHCPKGGTVYIFARNSFFEDGYAWKEILHKPDLRTESGRTLHYQLCYVASPQVSSKFQRETYEMEGLVLACYNGDESFVQRNIGERRATTVSMMPQPQPPTNSVMTSFHDWRQENYFGQQHQQQQQQQQQFFHRQEQIRDEYQQHPVFLSSSTKMGSSVNADEVSRLWYQDLASVAEELANGKVVKNLTIFPSLQMTLVHPDMTKEFENCCRLCVDPNDVTDETNNGIKLFYDTTLSFGRIYGTVLTFVNCCYEGNPVMPLAVNLHERKFKSSHQIFWARIVGDLPALQKYRFPLIIDDAEPAVHLAVKTQAPNLVQLEAWTHRFRDINLYLAGRGYGEEAIRYYQACIDYLLHSESKQAMHDRFRKEFESVWPKDFVFYYRQKLLPRSGRLGQWAMLKMKIRDELFLCPHTNPQVEFHIMCQNFQGWDRLSVDQLVRAFYFLFLYFVSESSDGKLVDDATFNMKRQFKSGHAYNKKQLRASYKYIPHPSQICDFILRNYPRAAPPSTQRWMAYGATEVYAKMADVASYPRGEPKMEDVCDIRYTLENLIQRNNLSEVEMDSLPLSDLTLTPMMDERRMSEYCHNGRGSNAQTIGGIAPPSPAPNGRVPSQAPPVKGAQDSKTQLSGMSQSKQVNNYSAALTTIPECPVENRPLSRLEWSYENEASSMGPKPPRLSEMRNSNLALQSQENEFSNDANRDQYHHSREGVAYGNCNEMANVDNTMSNAAAQNKDNSSREEGANALPPSLMLWRKVQHCVVFGGSFITATKERGNSRLKHE